MALGRHARGLPRYYMDVGWYRAPRFAGLRIDALFTYDAAVGYCTEHATDGHLPGDTEDLAVALGLRASDLAGAVPALVDRGILERCGDELVIPDWGDSNPTAVEIEEHSAAKSGAGSFGNHVRWHENRNRPDPDCQWCQQPPGAGPDPDPGIAPDRTRFANGSHSDSQPIANGSHLRSQTRSHPDRETPGHTGSDRNCDRTEDRNPIAPRSLGMGWDGIAITNSSSNNSREAIAPATRQGDSPPDDDGDQRVTGRVEAAARLLARRDLDDRQQAPGQRRIGDTAGWLRTATAGRLDRDGRALTEIARRHPDATPEQLADRVDPPPPDLWTHAGTITDPAAGARSAGEPITDLAAVRWQREAPTDPDPDGHGRTSARTALDHAKGTKAVARRRPSDEETPIQKASAL
jgi:hypothetical protein